LVDLNHANKKKQGNGDGNNIRACAKDKNSSPLTNGGFKIFRSIDSVFINNLKIIERRELIIFIQNIHFPQCFVDRAS
jgi:hypothetical protein